MKTFKTILTDIVSRAFEDCGYPSEGGQVTVSNRPDLCEFQCNGALVLAKKLSKNPKEIAENVIAKLERNPAFSVVSFAPPGFINLNVSNEFLACYISDMTKSERFLVPEIKDKKTLVIDYGGPNVAKPLHVGHLRTAIIGEALKRLSLFLGQKVVSDIHLGDWGLQMGLIIAQLEEEQPELCYFDESFIGEYPKESPVTVDDLNAIYPKASARSKTDEAFKEKAQAATKQLQEGKRGYVALWNHFISVSVGDLKKSYAKLNVDFEYWLGESDSAKYVPEVLKILEEKGLSYLDNGALIVDVSQENDTEEIPPIIVAKTDGSQLYATTDLATLIQRMKDFSPNEIWYVVDSRQGLHFKQVFRAAKKSGIVHEDTKLYHIGFGTMNGKDGKPYKTRDGGVMRLSDLIESVTSAAAEKVNASDATANLSVDEKAEIANKIGISALKIGDLVNHRAKDYVFDLERFMASEGKTGPYLLYSAVRMKSILKKARAEGISFGQISPIENQTAKQLQLQLTFVGDVLLRAYEEQALNPICEVLFDITGVFNRFYYENKILTNPNENERAVLLSLVELTLKMIEQLLNILAIDVPEVM